VRLPLDIFVVATANPEDYTNRGRIITPLKDRFDVQLRTHYPRKREHEIEIMAQEFRRLPLEGFDIRVPAFIKEILAEITFQARSSSEINQHSGVSCRVSIRSYEAILGSAIQRSLQLGETLAVPRITDIESIFPAIAGKIELSYEVADANGDEVVEDLAKRAIKTIFDQHFTVEELAEIIQAFKKGLSAEISQDQPSEAYLQGVHLIPGMRPAVTKIVDGSCGPEVAAALEFVLEGLHLSNALNRETLAGRVIYK
jgi:magnesium chelatase subunit I